MGVGGAIGSTLGAIFWFWRAPSTAYRRSALCEGYTLGGPSKVQKRRLRLPSTAVSRAIRWRMITADFESFPQPN
jgi:hypothetical protein